MMTSASKSTRSSRLEAGRAARAELSVSGALESTSRSSR
jgi:hypothetical protein